MAPTYDTAVIGLGAAGSAALYNLAARGRKAIGFEQFEPGHEFGSAHGESRIIRLSYFEHPSYVPLLKKAYDAWRRFETEDGGAPGSLLTITGILETCHPGSTVVQNSLASSKLHHLDHEPLSGDDIKKRFPAFHVPSHWVGLYQPDGGYLRPEASIKRFVAAAAKRGAEVRTQTRVLSVTPTANAILIRTPTETIEVGSVIVAAGAWIGDFAPWLKTHLKVTRQVVGWFPPIRPELFTPDVFPVFILESEEDHIYGFPNFSGSGVKSASHVVGRTLAHPDAMDRTVTAEDETQIAKTLLRYLPDVGAPASKLAACLYTRTADGHFLIDHWPDDHRIVLASPCSGHGFKFVSLFGEILADLADHGTTDHDISLFRYRDVAPAVAA
jgi:sarcosine oxidase